jgi:cell division protein FtsL
MRITSKIFRIIPSLQPTVKLPPILVPSKEEKEFTDNIENLDFYCSFMIVFLGVLIIYILFLTKQIHNLNHQILVVQDQIVCLNQHIHELIKLNSQLKAEIVEIFMDKDFIENLNKVNENINKKHITFGYYQTPLRFALLIGVTLSLSYGYVRVVVCLYYYFDIDNFDIDDYI